MSGWGVVGVEGAAVEEWGKTREYFELRRFMAIYLLQLLWRRKKSFDYALNRLP